MRYKLVILCPNKADVINKIIKAGAENGAGIIGNYTHNAYILAGMGNWKSEEGALPTIGKVGEMSREPEARVEMECPADNARVVIDAIKKVHPYETPVVDVYQLVDLS